MAVGKGIERQTLPKVVADRLRAEILSGEIPPGQRLIVKALVERFGVSHIPIREALRELEAESLLSSRPGSGVVVSKVDLDELHDLYQLRRLLEVDVIRRGFDSYAQADLDEADATFQALLTETPQPSDGDWWAAHERYHWAFLEPGMSPWSRKLLRLVWQSSERYQRLFVLVFGSVEDANRQHREMLEAAGSKDVETFINAWLRHLASTEATIVSGYEAEQAGSGEHLVGSGSERTRQPNVGLG